MQDFIIFYLQLYQTIFVVAGIYPSHHVPVKFLGPHLSNHSFEDRQVSLVDETRENLEEPRNAGCCTKRPETDILLRIVVFVELFNKFAWQLGFCKPDL
jgi:hypothetical protein